MRETTGHPPNNMYRICDAVAIVYIVYIVYMTHTPCMRNEGLPAVCLQRKRLQAVARACYFIIPICGLWTCSLYWIMCTICTLQYVHKCKCTYTYTIHTTIHTTEREREKERERERERTFFAAFLQICYLPVGEKPGTILQFPENSVTCCK